MTTPPEWLTICRSFIEAVGDQMVVIDKDYRVVMVNEAFVAANGLVEADVLGRACHDVTHHSPDPCWVAGAACPLANVVQHGRSSTVSHEHFDADGARRNVEIIGSPVHDGDGDVVAMIESIRDVTRQRQLEEALRERNAELEEARRKREEFTSTVCHELKNILNALSLQAQSLRVSTEPQQTQKRANVIVSEAKRLGRLIEDMRDASAIETQRFSVHPRPCELVPIVARCAENYQLSSERHSVSLEAADSTIDGYWDAQRIEQAVDNLLSNAVKYSPDGGDIRIAITRGDDTVTVAVSDSGLGIEPERIPHLFQPYARAHRDIQGVGLGLFVTRGIVEAHGGRIEVDSSPGQGATFRFTLPLAPPSAP